MSPMGAASNPIYLPITALSPAALYLYTTQPTQRRNSVGINQPSFPVPYPLLHTCRCASFTTSAKVKNKATGSQGTATPKIFTPFFLRGCPKRVGVRCEVGVVFGFCRRHELIFFYLFSLAVRNA